MIVSLPTSASSFTETKTQRSSSSPSSIVTPAFGQDCVFELSWKKVTVQPSSKVDSTSGMNISSFEPVLSNLTLNFTLFWVELPSYSGYISFELSIAVASSSLLGEATSRFTDT